MKNILYTFILSTLILVSCEPEKPVVEPEPEPKPEVEKTFAEKLIGDWHHSSSDIPAEIYVTFSTENKFVLYQKIGDGSFRIFNGTYEIKTEGEQNFLNGKYNDGTPWGAERTAEISSEDTLTLTAGGVDETYSRVSDGIPEDVKDNAVLVVKSGMLNSQPQYRWL